MQERIPYHEPSTPNIKPALPTPIRTLKVGAALCGSSIFVSSLSIEFRLLANHGLLLVALGLSFLGLVVGVNCLVNGFIDWLRGH